MGLDDGTYISWWPSDDVFESPARSYGMRNDRAEEAGKNPDYASAPISKLDEAAISKWWQEISGRSPGDLSQSRHEPRAAHGKFQLLKGANCSNMVVRGLFVGGFAKHYPLAATIVGSNPIMTPLTLIDIAEAATGDFGDKLLSMVRSPGPVTATVRSYWEYVGRRKLD